MDEEKKGIDLPTITLELSDQDIEHLSDKDGSESLDVTKTVGKDTFGNDQIIKLVYKEKVNAEGTPAADVPLQTEIEAEEEVTRQTPSGKTEVQAAVEDVINNPDVDITKQESVTIASFDKFLKLNS